MRKEVSVPEGIVMSKIYEVRGLKVMLDKDLAELYQVETKALKQAVRRNAAIFPEHFMFELTNGEGYSLRSQFVTQKAAEVAADTCPWSLPNTEYCSSQVYLGAIRQNK